MFGSLFGKISVNAVSTGEQLNKAIEKECTVFIQKRSENKPRKALVGLWLILFEDNEWVYWGYPKFRTIFSDSRYVDELYKTDKKKLLELNPNYKKDF
jgi:hypothetical protein